MILLQIGLAQRVRETADPSLYGPAMAARASYLAELRGNLKAAVGAMQLAAQSPGLAPENTAYVSAPSSATFSSTPAIQPLRPRHTRQPWTSCPPTLHHWPARPGSPSVPESWSKRSACTSEPPRSSPCPSMSWPAVNTQAAAGRTEDAKRSFELAQADIQLFKAAGVTVDVDPALLEADFGDPAAALEYAQVAHKATPTFRTADAVTWALHRLDRDQEALKFSKESLRLGSIDPLVRYHGGAIAAALGDDASARRDLELAEDRSGLLGHRRSGGPSPAGSPSLKSGAIGGRHRTSRLAALNAATNGSAAIPVTISTLAEASVANAADRPSSAIGTGVSPRYAGARKRT